MLLALQLRFVEFQHVQYGEHMAVMGVFFFMQIGSGRHLLSDRKMFQAFLRITVTCAGGVAVVALGVGTTFVPGVLVTVDWGHNLRRRFCGT
ncbi:hypothetical protein CerSpe_296130 [Prunus speciosa]